MGNRQFPLWRIFWLIAICAAFAFALTIHRIPENPTHPEGMRTHFPSQVGAINIAARFGLCGFILFRPFVMGRRVAPKAWTWRGISADQFAFLVLFAFDLALLALSAVIHHEAAAALKTISN